jgi:hypothetical protein
MNLLRRAVQEAHTFLRKTYLYVYAVPIAILFLGIVSNQAVLIANHDTFPVLINDAKVTELTAHNQEEAKFRAKIGFPIPVTYPMLRDKTVYLDDIHVVMTPQTHLNALADVWDLGEGIFSVGDFALILGGDVLLPLSPIVWFILVARKLYVD